LIVEIGQFIEENTKYDAIGIDETGKVLGVGFANNEKYSILISEVEDGFNVSFNEKLKPFEVLDFFINIIEKIKAKFVVIGDFK
jgi:hypothetical protein